MKPLMRGYVHEAAFYVAFGACMVLIMRSQGTQAVIASIIYSFCLIGLYGVSALYHRPMWNSQQYFLMRRIDHAAIFALIAGSATPICLLGLNNKAGFQLLFITWLFAIIGMIIAVFWIHGPKWVRAISYVAVGWIFIPYVSQIKSSLGTSNMRLLIIGGVIYTVGAVVYAFRRPNPFPRVFGYHEIFHILVVIASGFHFWVIYILAT
jgi:hemolysin III